MIKEPIYGSVLSLKFNDAWNSVVEFSKAYPIKRIDRDNSTIVLDVSYPIRMFTYFTWAEGIIISLKSLSDDATMININGKVLLSPHHFFRSSALNKKKIDKNTFLSNTKLFFNKHVTIMPKYTKDDTNKKTIFLLLELFSIVIASLIVIQKLLFGLQINSLIVIISVILFSLSQAALIIWFTRECYNRIDLSNAQRNKWVTFVCITGFIGCFFYYTKMGLRTSGQYGSRRGTAIKS